MAAAKKVNLRMDGSFFRKTRRSSGLHNYRKITNVSPQKTAVAGDEGGTGPAP